MFLEKRKGNHDVRVKGLHVGHVRVYVVNYVRDVCYDMSMCHNMFDR